MLPGLIKAAVIGPYKLIIKLVVIVFVLLLLAALYFMLTFDLDGYKSQIEEKASAALGRDVAIKGDIGWGIDNLTPSVTAKEVVIGPAKKPEGSVGKLEIALSLASVGDVMRQEFSDQPTIKINLDKLVWQGREIGDFRLPLQLRPDGFALLPVTGDISPDGKLEAYIEYTGGEMKASLEIEDIDYEQLASGASGGPLTAKAELSSKGANTDQIIANLNGIVELKGGAGLIEAQGLRLFGDDLIAGVLSARQKKNKIVCTTALGRIEKGVMRLENSALDTEHVLMLIGGSVDLRRERLKLLMTPKPHNNTLISLATPLRIEGNWANPSVKPDNRAMAEKVGGLMLGAIAPPAALLSFSQRGAEGQSPCR